MTLIQWFFTVWILGAPMQVGPFVNLTQCENMMESYVERYTREHGDPPQWKLKSGESHAYKPACLMHEFQLEPYSRPKP